MTLIASLGCLLLAIVGGERVPLWPEGKIPDFQEHQIGEMTDVAGNYPNKPKEGFDASAHRMPYLQWFDKPANPNGSCIILISGGSYMCCCDVGLIKMWRDRFTALGYQTVNLVYRTPRAKGLPIYHSAWQDGQRAVRLVRAAAKERGFNPEKIGAISMSAGSHLNVLLATSSLTPAYAKVDAVDELPCNLAFAIADAPAYATTDANEQGTPAYRNGYGVDVAVDPAFKFDAKTCPMCLCHGAVDAYSPNGSTLIYRELRKRKVPAEIHLYADCGHGAFGLDRAIEFLRTLGFHGQLAPAVSVTERYPEGKAAPTAKVDLWPAGRMPYASSKQEKPYLEWFIPTNLVTKAIQVIFPGGAYMNCSMEKEGYAPARFFNAKGMAAVVVRYRTPRPAAPLAKHTTAFQDAQRAIRIVRSEAASRGLDPNRIGVMGYSAGGHLTLMCATSSRSRSYYPGIVGDEIEKLPATVQWAFPVYPAYALTDGGNEPNTRGGNDDRAILVPEFVFDPDTPVMCFNHGDADGYAAMNSVKVWEKLRMMGLSSDLHTYVTRGHCFQFNASPETGSYTWMDRLWDFLTKKGLNK